MTEVKICGLSSPGTLTKAIDLKADYIGFVFHDSSPRYVDIETAGYLSSFIPKTVKVVGLFVNAYDQYMDQVIRNVHLDMIQLHGTEKPKDVQVIKEKFQKPIIKALSIETAEDLEKAAEFEGIADWFLFDAKPKNNEKELPGGNGQSFDWHILKDYMGDTPFMLAGGLTPENVSEAIKIAAPDAVDVSSGVESTRGVKDTNKIEAFIQAVKQA